MNKEEISKILWKIHSHSLFPFYVEKKEFEENWETLPEISKNDEEVSKEFFNKIAEFLINTK